MNKSSIVNQIAFNLYNKTCKKAIELAKFTGDNNERVNQFNSNVPHDISNLIWDTNFNRIESINLCFEIYEDMPCYAHLISLNMEYAYFSLAERKHTIEKIYHYLSLGNNTYFKPIEYSLWCDFFEDDSTVTEVWSGLIKANENKKIYTSLLNVSGPVPFYLKNKLYELLLDNKEYHYMIFNSLLYSYYDYYGKIDIGKARQIMDILEIDKTIKEVKDFMRILN